METNQETIDIFNGISFKWEMISKKTSPKHISDTDKSSTSACVSKLRYFELTFHKQHKQIAIDTYLPHLLSKSKEAREETKTLKLFTLAMDGKKPWQSVKLDHPATFDTLAMDSELKNRIINDLDRFAKRKGFYKRVGKAWKRGYLLFGPPGTGKSSLIATMANYLKFDIYDLELTDIRNNSQLRRLLISTGNKSILVVEDIDCSIELQNRSKTAKSLNPLQSDRGYQVNLSGFLNFIDGLWSSCGDERVIVFTTNHKDRLDPALLRPGRMDMHIHMSYCTPCGFKMLASNYFGIEEHPLFVEIEQLIAITKVTPAEIGEQLMKEEEAEIAFRGVVYFLEGKKKESDEIKASEVTEEEKIES